VTQLAEFLRHALADPAGREVTLGEELEVVDAYLDVERARLGQALRVRTEVEPDVVELPIPSFLLYPLVENAIKHARRDGEGAATVEIRARREGRRLVVEIANPGRLETRGAHPAGAGVGLRNVRQRLAHTHPGRSALTLEEDGGWVRARLEIEARGVTTPSDG
jgi:two-component system sensor histidine kinase AlgZ